MVATVEIRLVGSDLARAMSDMRVWLDRQRVVPHAFRQSTCPGGLALHIDFNKEDDADGFAARFHGRVLGSPPSPLGEAPTTFAEPVGESHRR